MLWKVAKELTMVGQLGFMILTPPVVMALLGWWLQSRLGLGTWVMLACLLIGLLTAAVSAYRFGRRIMDEAKKKTDGGKDTKKQVVFYSHE